MNVFDLYATLRLETSEYTNALNDAGNKASSFGENLKNGLLTAAKVITTAVGAAATAVTAFAASSVKTGMSFDAAMSQISATLGLSVQDIQNNVDGAGETFDLLREKAMQMGSETNFSATEAAQGLNILAMSGYDATQSMSMIEDVLHLAAAGSMDMASAAGFVSGAMKGFSDETKNSAYYADLMAKGATLANTDVTQLGAALSDAAATSKTYGQSAEATTLALLRLAEQGEVGTAASTALAAAMKNLYAPTNQAKKVMQELGVNAFDPASGSARDFNVVVNELQDALSGYTDEQRTAYAQTIFGIQGFDAYNKMIVTSVEKQNEWSKALQESSGEAAKQYDTMTDNLLGDVDKWNSALEGFQLVLSDQLTPTVRQFVQFGTEAISTLSTAFKDGGLSGAMDALNSILSDGLNMIIEQLPKFVDAGMQLLGALGQGILDNLPAITDAAVQIILVLVNGIIDGLPALAEGAVQIITQLATGIGKALPELIPAAVEAVLKFIEGLTNPESIQNLVEAAVQLIVGLNEGLAKAVPILIEYAPEIIAGLVSGLIAASPQLVEAGVQLTMGILEGLVQAIVAIPSAIAKVASAIIDGFKALFGIHSPSTVMAEQGVALIDGLLKGISDTWESIVEFFSGAAESLISFLDETWGTIQKSAGEAWEAIKEAVSSAWDGITAVWNAATGFFGDIWNGIKTAGNDAASAVQNAVVGAWNAISSAWNGAVSFFSGIWDSIKGVFGNALDTFSGIGKNIVDGIRNGVSNAWSGLTSWLGGMFKSLVNSIKSTLGIASPSKVFAGIGGNMAIGLGEGWDDKFRTIKSKIENGMDFGPAHVGLVANGTYNATGNAQRGTDMGFNGMIPTVVNIYNPEKKDAITESREWKKTAQRAAMGYV